MLRIILTTIACLQLSNSLLHTDCETKHGIKGTCIPITDCPHLTELLNAGDVSDLTNCHFDGIIGLFCCPTTNISSTNLRVTESCKRIIERRDHDGINVASATSFMAQIFLLESGYVGSGVLVSELFILTSANIVYTRRSMPTVRLGKVIISNLYLLKFIN